MALLIEKSVQILGGIQINEFYARIGYYADKSGKIISANISCYYNKDSYLSDPNSNIIKISGFVEGPIYNYDRESDGDNILLFLHEKIKEEISTDIYKSEPIIDPSTGNPDIDPSTGEILYEEVLVKPKFVDEEDISFVDID